MLFRAVLQIWQVQPNLQANNAIKGEVRPSLVVGVNVGGQPTLVS